MDTEPPRLDIQVVSDVVCPWCYIGKRQLEQALARWRATHTDAVPVRVRWRPFQLNPGLPAAGMDRADYLERKFGTRDGGAIYARVREAAADVGLALAFERIARQPNTRAAHALIEAAGADGGDQDALVEALFRGYFIDGENLCDRDTLLAMAAGAGLDATRAARALDDADGLERIDAQDAKARELGIRGVPFFIVNGRVGVSGAAGADALGQAFEQALAGAEAD